MEDTVGRKMLRTENESEYRHDDQPAADTQQPGKEADDRT